MKEEFIQALIDSPASFTELCREFGISRKTGYKWKHRFEAYGNDGLRSLPKCRKKPPCQLEENRVCEIVRIRGLHPTWGAAKIKELIKRQCGCELGISSIYRVLVRSGLIERRHIRAVQRVRREKPCMRAQLPNEVWSIDYKGYWFSREKKKCNPLTIRDDKNVTSTSSNVLPHC